MLVVNPEKRFTVDHCLAHPWMTASNPGVNDSTDGLVGGFAGLEVNRRGVVRERTLLSSINSVQITRIPAPDGKEPIEVYKKNPHAPVREMRPYDARNPEEFVAMGGKGDQELFKENSYYSKNDLPAPANISPAATPVQNGGGNTTKAKASKGKSKGGKH